MTSFDPADWTDCKPKYRNKPLPEFKGNPLVEALYPIPDNDKETLLRMTRKPAFNISECHLPNSARILCVDRLHNFFFANAKHVEILQDIYASVMNGYRNAKPRDPEFQKKLHKFSTRRCPAGISLLTGPSGSGKSTLMRVIQEYFGATVIAHSTYKKKPFPEAQIPFLRINLPDSCSTKAICEGLCRLTNELLGINHYERKDYSLLRRICG